MSTRRRAAPLRSRRGAALIVALALLTILTLLTITGVSTATTELVLAGNEQYRRGASMAASAGIEQAIGAIATVSTVPGAAPVIATEVIVNGSPDAVPSGERFVTATRYVGEESGLPQSSAERYVGLHYEIDSTGAARRGAHERQLQGIMVIAAAGAGRFARLGRGLGEAGD